MGSWNSSKDREVDRKNEQAFKQFLLSKYERKQWYKPPEVVREDTSKQEAKQEAKAEPKIQPPPSKV